MQRTRETSVPKSERRLIRSSGAVRISGEPLHAPEPPIRAFSTRSIKLGGPVIVVVELFRRDTPRVEKETNGISRFSRLKFPDMLWFYDSAVPLDDLP